MSEDVLNDLEDLVDGNWQDIFEEYKSEERKKELAEPVIPAFPSYDEFYETLLNSLNDPNISYHVSSLIHRVLRHQDRKKSSSFDNIWSLFCDPSRANQQEEVCNHCGREQTIVWINSSYNIDWSTRAMDSVQEISVERTPVFCINCGGSFHYVVGKLVGVFV